MVSDADRLVGTWRLITYVVEGPDGSVIDAPYGPNPVGQLVYTTEGRVSVHAMAPDRTACGSSRISTCPDPVKVRSFDTHFSYTGNFRFDGETVNHDVKISSFPDWSGVTLQRTVQIDEDTLVLTGPRGNERVPVLSWRREG